MDHDASRRASLQGPSVGDSRATWVDLIARDADGATDVRPTVGDRYVLGRRAGRGAFGAVYVATDRNDQRQVAVKVFHEDHEAALTDLERESAALRVLKLPGVVAYESAGLAQGALYLAMEWVDGTPFPGVEDRSWSSLAQQAVGLVEVVARVHRTGVIHGDLKPANVLVRPDGRIAVLDFGLAYLRTASSGQSAWRLEGTPLYLAPERLLGYPPSPQTDAFAVGVMLYEALCGALPEEQLSVADLLMSRAEGRVPQASDLPADVPSEVRDVIGALLAPRPEHRPATLDEVLPGLLAACPPSPLDACVASATEAGDLTQAFVGPDRIFHLREDAAKVARRRAEEAGRSVAQEVGAWVRAGLAKRVDDRLSVPRESIDLLELGLDHGGVFGPRRARSLDTFVQRVLAADLEGALEAADAAVAWAEQAEQRELAWSLALEALDIARRLERAEEQADWAARATSMAVRTMNARRIELARRSVLRAGATWCARLLEGAAAGIAGRRDECLGMLEGLGPGPSDQVEAWRLAVMVFVRSRDDVASQEEAVERAGAAVPASEAYRALAWRASLRYRQGRYLEAAALHLAASVSSSSRAAAVGQLLNAGVAWLETDLHAQAALSMEALAEDASLRRNPVSAAVREYVSRAARYRSAEDLVPDLELCEAVEHLGYANQCAAVWAVEAAVAWRAGDPATCRTMAERASFWFRKAGNHAGGAMADALRVHVGEPWSDDQVGSLLTEALAGPHPGLAVQAAGLLAASRPHLDRAAWERALARAPELSAADPDRRREVCSVAEATAWLRAALAS